MTYPTSGSFARLLIVAITAVLTGGVVAIAAPAPAHAEQNMPGTAIYGPFELYAYVEAGETVTWDFVKLQGTGQVNLHVDGPDGTDLGCSMTAPATNCNGSASPATVTGIWRFQFSTAGTANANDHASTWQIEVSDGGGAIPGRVWTEAYEMSNLDFTSTVSFDLWYLGEFGDLYRMHYADFNGVNSTFLASGVGLVPLTGSSCVPQYRSSQRQGELNPADPNPPLRPLQTGECGGRYKIFFDEPDAGLPASAVRWDGATTWLNPPVTDPVLSNVTFTHSDAGPLTGTLGFRVTDFQGALQILVDANGDGDTTDPEDRTIPYFVSSLAGPDHTLAFDGRDGLGAEIPTGTQVTFTVSITRTGEVHFVNTDVETRGGLQIESLRGPQAGDDRLYFDDRALGGAVSAQKCSTTPVLDGRAGIPTTAGPVHGWLDCGVPVNFPPTNVNNGFAGSWGDSRHIHDWSFRTVNIAASVQAVGQPVLAPTGGGSPLPPMIAVGALLVGGLALLGLRRRTRSTD